jgi:hypothetical protein
MSGGPGTTSSEWPSFLAIADRGIGCAPEYTPPGRWNVRRKYLESSAIDSTALATRL